MNPLSLIPVQYRALAIAGAILLAVVTLYGVAHHQGVTSTTDKYEAIIAKMIADNEHEVAEAKAAAQKADQEQVKSIRAQLDWQAATSRMHASSFDTLRKETRTAPVEPSGIDAPAHPLILKTIRRGAIK